MVVGWGENLRERERERESERETLFLSWRDE